METNLEKAKRLVKDNAAIQGVEIPEDGFIFKMLELAATPNVVNKISSNPMLADSLPCEHIYSRTMKQEYPRKCVKCGEVEKANFR